jgi:fido (protein-threonine AMPylation protein)
MSTPAEKIAESLEELKKIQESGITAIRADALSRTHRERLLENGFIREVIKGWYFPSRPGSKEGETTSWYSSYWNFCTEYFNSRFSGDWCLSPEQSISIHSGNMTVPEQLLVRSPKANNNLTKLLYGTSFLEANLKIPDKKDLFVKRGIIIYSLPLALISCSESLYKQSPGDIRALLLLIKDSSQILRPLLEGGHSTVAGRLAGAFRNIDRPKIADEIMVTMKSAGYDVREKDPFTEKLPVMVFENDKSPFVYRITLMWQQMRKIVIDSFPETPGLSLDIPGFLMKVDDIYKTDAYHSLSIEGYKVSAELIEKVRTGNWKPDISKEDQEYKNALAARGYWQAFQVVKESIKKILEGQVSGTVLKEDHGTWYRELFAPSVTAGILNQSDLAGYRNNDVFISQSRYVPPDPDSVRDAMPALFELLETETESSVRAVLGHFIFVYIHPYSDGNGRIARFLMNAMLAAGGYSWIVIPVEKRDSYMAALEKASIGQDISSFTKFISDMVSG